ncbi:LytTR family transcriptional regulator DNA-binding domain-containing protein [Lunatimonas salinarum]|uniref:LytTR family transcriptional regulator DNA-binding domain-containing protein n=1 Tax=Lunatimonas salinarum TaxID=1774590 RepID=UPI001AE0E686
MTLFALFGRRRFLDHFRCFWDGLKKRLIPSPHPWIFPILNHFIRIHKSYLINRHQIEFVEGNQVSIAGVKLPVGQTYKSNLLGFLN